MHGPVLGIDFGTSNTAGVLRRAGQPAVPLIFDGSPLLPSAVFLDLESGLMVGRDAERSAAVAPGRFEPNPKRRIDDGTLWLGERDVAVAEAVAAVLTRVVREAERVAGGPAERVVLTCPVGWGGQRLRILADAAARAGLSDPLFVAEPVAAASYLVDVLDQRIPVGRSVVVYDLGAGTFDVAVVRRTGDGFSVLAADGLADLGGLDLDAAVVGRVRAATAGSIDAWQRLERPESTADRRARRLLWQDAREAKEQLSRHATAALHVPLVDTDWHLTREEFEAVARPLLEPTVRVTLATLRTAGVEPAAVGGIFLVGGSSRVPLVATLLHSSLRIAPTVIEQPELVVGIGAVYAATSATPAALVPDPATTEPGVVAERPAAGRAHAAGAGVSRAAHPVAARGTAPVRSAEAPARAATGRGDRLLRWIGLCVAAVVAVGVAGRALLVQRRVEDGYLPGEDAIRIAIGEIAFDVVIAVAVLFLTWVGGTRARAGAALLIGYAGLQIADLPTFLDESTAFGSMSAVIGMRAAPLQGLLLLTLAVPALVVLLRTRSQGAPARRRDGRLTTAVVTGAFAVAVPLAAYRVDPETAVSVTAWVMVVAIVVAALPVIAATRRSRATVTGLLVAFATLVPAPTLSPLFQTGETPPGQALLIAAAATAVVVTAALAIRRPTEPQSP
ncbi:Hsp70 family protein [Virgisporangium ochraceum]|uniref:Hsp70 family protein n=1 Tax=Virgisporangium ochraceum TaxID=65505 RepID=UPI001943CCE8|nr:Hsp70 family protein [Virgisporangium ochraceum]